MAVFNDLIDSAVLDTAWGPRIQILPGPPPGPPGKGPPGKGPAKPVRSAAGFLQPKLTVKAMGETFTFAPYGEPGKTKWPWVKLGAGVVLFLLFVGMGSTGKVVYDYVKKRRKR